MRSHVPEISFLTKIMYQYLRENPGIKRILPHMHKLAGKSRDPGLCRDYMILPETHSLFEEDLSSTEDHSKSAEVGSSLTEVNSKLT